MAEIGLYVFVALIAFPMLILLMASVLRRCGVSEADIAKWALRQADRNRFVGLIRAARDVAPSLEPPAELPSSADSTERPAA